MRTDFFNHPIEKIYRAKSSAINVTIGYLESTIESSSCEKEVEFAKGLLEVIKIELAEVLIKE